MNADALIEGTYIKAAEFGDKLPASPTYTIARVEVERMADLKRPGSEINKGVVFFHEIDRGWVMNRTNVECLKALLGPDTSGWVGRRVTLGTEPTKTGPGIRVMGSPEITAPVIARWTPPRQRQVTRRLEPTGAAVGRAELVAACERARERGASLDQIRAVLGGRAAEVPPDRVPEAVQAIDALEGA